MWNNGRETAAAGGRRGAEAGGGGGSLAVAVDRGKASRCALRWVLENVVSSDQTVKLVHVLQRAPTPPPPPPPHPFPDRSNSLSEIRQPDGPTVELLLPFRCYCMRRQVKCEAVVIEDLDVARGLVKFVSYYAVENLFLGAVSKSFSRLFKNVDTPSTVMKSAPDFCNVYVIGRGKVTSRRTATRQAPAAAAEEARLDGVRQLRRGSSSETAYDEISESENEVMCADSGRPSTDSNFLAFYENLGSMAQDDPGRHWGFDERDFDPDPITGSKQRVDPDPDNDLPTDKDGRVLQALNNGLMEEDARRLAAEFQLTMDMYHEACGEATVAKQMILELAKCKMEAERKMQDAQQSESAAMSMLEEEKARCREALEAAEVARRLAGRELQRRLRAESRAFREAEEKRRMMGAAGLTDTVVEWRSLFHISVALVLLYVYFQRFLGKPSS